jgi:hypothetical protein
MKEVLCNSYNQMIAMSHKQRTTKCNENGVRLDGRSCGL